MSKMSRQEIDAEWKTLSAGYFRPLGVEPLYYGACESDLCVGVFVHSQTCVCPIKAGK